MLHFLFNMYSIHQFLFAAFIRRIIDNSFDDSPLFHAKNFPFVFAQVSQSQIYSVPG